MNNIEQEKETLKELLTSGYVYDILAALRGPDFSFTRERVGASGRIADEVKTRRLKELTTQRIRAVVGMPVYQSSAMVRTSPLSKEEQTERNSLLWDKETPEHFRQHYEFAVAAIRNLYFYDLRNESPL